jgi:general secretion pathway protein G
MELLTRNGERPPSRSEHNPERVNSLRPRARLTAEAPARERVLGRNGYTLIEMIIVMAIISILIAIAVPLYQKSLLRTKESLLKNNLFTLRTVIDEYTYDKQKAPQTLDDLVNDGYLRAVPLDPITNSSQSWRLVMEDAVTSVDQTMPGIYDVRSGSDQKSLEGTPYAEW